MKLIVTAHSQFSCNPAAPPLHRVVLPSKNINLNLKTKKATAYATVTPYFYLLNIQLTIAGKYLLT
jgi:hypothetical protein